MLLAFCCAWAGWGSAGWGVVWAAGLPVVPLAPSEQGAPLPQPLPPSLGSPASPFVSGQPAPPVLPVPSTPSLAAVQTGAAPSPEQVSAPACDGGAVPWQALAPGVWVWPAAKLGEVSPHNRGHVVPSSVLLDGARAWVIDPGPSWAHGQRLRAALACRFGAEVAGVINTHAHAENVLANAGALGRPPAEASASPEQPGEANAEPVATARPDEAPVWASAATRQSMAQRCAACLHSLHQRVGVLAMAGTEALLPSQTLRHGSTLWLGAQRLEVRLLPHGHTELDTVLWAPDAGVLWVGGLVYQDRLPELAQGSLLGWLRALEDLRALRPRWVVGNAVSAASGPGLPPAWVQTEAYLRALRARVLAAMDAGHDVNDPHWHALPAFAHWAGYAERQRFNAHRAWRELEPLWMAGATGARDSALQQPGR